MATTNLYTAAQSLQPGNLIELFQLHLAPLGVPDILYFTKHRNPDGSRLLFGGVPYASVEVESKGWEVTGQGSFPQPTIKINNALRFFNGLTINNGDLIGARLIRLRTYEQFLDAGATPDSGAIFDPDVFNINQKINHDKNEIEWKLAAASDQEGVTLPKRRMWRDTCSLRYRLVRDNGTFDYSNATCPYTDESRFFDEFGQPTDRFHDECGLKLSDCTKRFAPNGNRGAPVPMQAFPGLLRNNV